MKKSILFLLSVFSLLILQAETGYELWLRYKPVNNKTLLQLYRRDITSIIVTGSSATMGIVNTELKNGLTGLLEINPNQLISVTSNGTIIAGTPVSSPIISKAGINSMLENTGEEGFIIISKVINNKNCIIISGNSDVAVLYGTFHFLRLLQTEKSIENLNITSAPKLKLRLLNHWDNLN